MSTGLLNSLMNAQSQTADPAGAPMQVEMLPIDWIIPNPDNKIYHVGDVSQLAEDIRKNGVRQPLEVVRTGGMTYKLIGGERRLTACQELLDGGDDRFSSLPCIVLESKGELDDKIALITANATARELTDGERLAQYEALKDALTEKKQAGQLEGKVRDALCKILGEGSGTLARLNAISANCTEDVKAKLHRGEIGLMEAYRYAQSVAETQRKAKQPEPPKTEPPKTLPQNPDYAEWNLPPEAIEMVEKAHLEAEIAKPAADLATQAREKPFPADISSRELNALIKLAKKTLGDNAPWALYLCEPKFKVEYYTQSLPGGATLWMRVDETAKERERVDFADYAIILQDNSFYTDGWEARGCIADSLGKWFNLTK